MPGRALTIGPTHALRLALETHTSLSPLDAIRHMGELGVGDARARRAIRRALAHAQVAQDARGRLYLSRGPGSW